MKAENLLFDESGEGEVVKQVGEESPNVWISVLAQTFIVKPVDLCDLAAFMITAQDGDAMWVSYFEGHQERYRLHGIVTTIHIVSHKKIIGRGHLASDFEQLHQIMKLSMNIAAHCDRTADRLNI